MAQQSTYSVTYHSKTPMTRHLAPRILMLIVAVLIIAYKEIRHRSFNSKSLIQKHPDRYRYMHELIKDAVFNVFESALDHQINNKAYYRTQTQIPTFRRLACNHTNTPPNRAPRSSHHAFYQRTSRVRSRGYPLVPMKCIKALRTEQGRRRCSDMAHLCGCFSPNSWTELGHAGCVGDWSRGDSVHSYAVRTPLEGECPAEQAEKHP